MINLSSESKELLEKITGDVQSVNGPDICSEEGIELAVIGHDKEHIKCFLCVKRFNTTSTFDQHLLEEHEEDYEVLESLNRYVKLLPKQKGICHENLCSSQIILLRTYFRSEVAANFFNSIFR